MTRIKQVFDHGKAFIPFITAGDPNLDITAELIPAMAAAGADLIEIGIPFSDPTAEGAVIQAANERALAAGTTTEKIFTMLMQVREKTKVPLAFMTYTNPVFVYGPERFMQQAAACGIDAVIVPDLPFEEKDELQPYCEAAGIDLISMIAPTSKERIVRIAAQARGFVYCVSSLGVTGVRSEITTDIAEMVRLVKATRDIPCAIGFGISTPEQARDLSNQADGIIVGSAIVKMIGELGLECVEPIAGYVRRMKAAMG